jgi:membrane-associated PAP2 superfamily phosphatase
MTLILIRWLGFLFGIFIPFILGIIKEIYDEMFGSHFSWGDIVADVLGILVALSFYIK